MKNQADYFGRIEDHPLSVECFANKKRMHNPQNKEAAFAFQFHEDVSNLFRFAHIKTDIEKKAFKAALEGLKANIQAYENSN